MKKYEGFLQTNKKIVSHLLTQRLSRGIEYTESGNYNDLSPFSYLIPNNTIITATSINKIKNHIKLFDNNDFFGKYNSDSNVNINVS